jgi:hypothetical protein
MNLDTFTTLDWWREDRRRAEEDRSVDAGGFLRRCLLLSHN